MSSRKRKTIDPEQVHWMTWHGKLGNKDWPRPVCAAKTDKVNRKDQGNKTNASEFVDHPKVMDAKMKIVADLIKTKDSVMKDVEVLDRPEYALPTYSHYCLSNLEELGMLHYYVQQNHDGLPQKAGFPQEKMNEIHGAWFDPFNPVVQFSEKLRSDLFRDMFSIEEKIDLCLCLGTSLSGMNADRCVTTPCEKFAGGVEGCYGSVIVNLQFTPVDIPGYVPIRVWGRIDDAFKLLFKHLGMKMKQRKMKEISEQEKDCIVCPYNKKGQFDESKKMVLDLSKGKKVVICNPHAKNNGQIGVVGEKDLHGHYDILFTNGKVRIWRTLGKWWLPAFKEGKIRRLPLMNVKPKFLK